MEILEFTEHDAIYSADSYPGLGLYLVKQQEKGGASWLYLCYKDNLFVDTNMVCKLDNPVAKALIEFVERALEPRPTEPTPGMASPKPLDLHIVMDPNFPKFSKNDLIDILRAVHGI